MKKQCVITIGSMHEEINFLNQRSLAKIIEAGWLLHSRIATNQNSITYVFETTLDIPPIPAAWPWEPKAKAGGRA